MDLKSLFTRKAPETAETPPEAVATTDPGPSASDQQFIQTILDNSAKQLADSFVSGLLAEHRITPAESAQWKDGFMNALRADGEGKVIASATGAVFEGSMTAQIRSMASARPQHQLTQTVLASAPAGGALVTSEHEDIAAQKSQMAAAYRAHGGFGGKA